MRSIVLALCVGGLAAGSPEQVQAVLTTIDTIPSQRQINHAFGDDPHQAAVGLGEIADDADADLGVRLRAIHALSKYCGDPCLHSDPAHLVLYDLVRSIGATDASSEDLVILRAALEAIGPQRALDDPSPDPAPSDEVVLVSHLSSLSRDVRTAAVHGLRDLCNTQAITPLGQLQSTETSKQVLQAITEALRVLRTDPCQ
ncbi:MAG: hypothetical protein ABI678_16265 [Kofleriaceae bacterium]